MLRQHKYDHFYPYPDFSRFIKSSCENNIVVSRMSMIGSVHGILKTVSVYVVCVCVVWMEKVFLSPKILGFCEKHHHLSNMGSSSHQQISSKL